MTKPNTTPRPVLVVDFGAQYAQLIARRVREAKIYSEVVPHSASVEEIKAKDPAALILSGGPSSVYADGAPALKPELLELGIPVFGICYGFQAMNHALGGTVSSTGEREYGRTDMNVKGGVLHAGLETTHKVWMSHGDAVSAAPEGFEVTATSAGAPVAAMECLEKKMAGVQYHPEVQHSPHGQEVLTRFLTEIAGLEQNWTADNIAEQLIADVRAQVGEEALRLQRRHAAHAGCRYRLAEHLVDAVAGREDARHRGAGRARLDRDIAALGINADGHFARKLFAGFLYQVRVAHGDRAENDP